MGAICHEGRSGASHLFPLLLCASLVISASGKAQSAHTTRAAQDDGPVCLGFSFGTWKPKLNWQAAGHGGFPDTTKMQHAPDGREWAIHGDKGDSTLILFPAWWPVGVAVILPTRTPMPGDTVSGDAIAFRANGDSTSPRTKVRAWRVKCGGG